MTDLSIEEVVRGYRRELDAMRAEARRPGPNNEFAHSSEQHLDRLGIEPAPELVAALARERNRLL